MEEPGEGVLRPCEEACRAQGWAVLLKVQSRGLCSLLLSAPDPSVSAPQGLREWYSLGSAVSLLPSLALPI